MKKLMVFLENLRSLQDNFFTDWEKIFGNFWGYAKNNIYWNKKHKRWEGEAFNMLFFSVSYVLADDEAKDSVNHYISMVQELGTGSLFKEVE